jgi:hypothetical protein
VTLSDELLETAESLLRRNKHRPTQADIRRSISTAYYALFHRLIEMTTSQLVSDILQRQAFARTFSHTSMKEICELVTRRPLPPAAVPFFGATIPNELQIIASTFSGLQELRHDADYNQGIVFSRLDGLTAVESVKDAFTTWNLIPSSVVQPFLVLLLIGKRQLR